MIQAGVVSEETGCWSFRLPERQLPRPLYLAVDKVLKGAGGKWHQGTRTHRFARDPRGLLRLAVSTGMAINRQQRDQAFFTPPEVADLLVGHLGDLTGCSILEPSAGEGALCDALIRAGADRNLIQCCERDPDSASRLRAKGYLVWQADFLQLNPEESEHFDRLIMNPPFADRQDVRHVSHALRFLNLSGILVAVMSASTLTRSDRLTQDFRRSVSDLGGEWHPLPPGAFKESGTNVATTVLRIGGVR